LETGVKEVEIFDDYVKDDAWMKELMDVITKKVSAKSASTEKDEDKQKND